MLDGWNVRSYMVISPLPCKIEGRFILIWLQVDEIETFNSPLEVEYVEE